MIRPSRFRRTTIDILRLGATVRTVPLQRTMALSPLVEAHRLTRPPLPWTAIFTKGYALVAQEVPELRQAYLRFPIPHIHQYPRSAAAIAVERMVGTEPVVCPLIIEDPAGLDLTAIGRSIRHAKSAEAESIPQFRRAARVATLPWPLRPLALRAAYNIPHLRFHAFGTFGVTVLASEGIEVLDMITPLPSVLTYSAFAPDGTIRVRMMFDHRLIDGAPAARALVRLEHILNGPIAKEVAGVAQIPSPRRQREVS